MVVIVVYKPTYNWGPHPVGVLMDLDGIWIRTLTDVDGIYHGNSMVLCGRIWDLNGVVSFNRTTDLMDENCGLFWLKTKLTI